MLLVAGCLAVFLLAFANGANDNAKPVATLVGAGLAGPRRALLAGTLAALAGSLLAVFLGQALIAGFSAKGLVGADVASTTPFLAGVAAGAALTVLAATHFGLPISTTHALIGAIVGAGVVSGSVDFVLLGGVFLLPLLTSPALAAGATAALYPVAHRIRLRSGITKESCLCIGAEIVPAANATAALRLTATADTTAACGERYRGALLGIGAERGAAAAHWLSALALSFARGLQDGAKIAGIGLLLAGTSHAGAIAATIALAMALGGLLAAHRVGETLAHRITEMNHGQALLANLLATTILLGATAIGAPVSTTHVTTGSLVGVRAHTGGSPESRLGQVLWAWVVTLPLAGLLAAAAALLAR